MHFLTFKSHFPKTFSTPKLDLIVVISKNFKFLAFFSKSGSVLQNFGTEFWLKKMKNTHFRSRIFLFRRLQGHFWFSKRPENFTVTWKENCGSSQQTAVVVLSCTKLLKLSKEKERAYFRSGRAFQAPPFPHATAQRSGGPPAALFYAKFSRRCQASLADNHPNAGRREHLTRVHELFSVLVLFQDFEFLVLHWIRIERLYF